MNKPQKYLTNVYIYRKINKKVVLSSSSDEKEKGVPIDAGRLSARDVEVDSRADNLKHTVVEKIPSYSFKRKNITASRQQKFASERRQV